MSARAASWLAWSLAGLSVALFVFSVALYALARSAQVPSSLVASRTLIDLVVSVPVLAFPVVGALIAYKRPKNPIGWICLAEGFLWMFLDMIDYYGVYGLAKPGSVPFPVVVYALGQWLWVPTVGLLAVYLVLLFPMEGFWCGDCVGERHPGAPRAVAEARATAQPVRLEGQPWVADASNAILVVFLLCILASATRLILRYRRSRGEERQQIKWIPFAASFIGLGFVTAMVSALIALVFAPEVWGNAGTPRSGLNSCFLWWC